MTEQEKVNTEVQTKLATQDAKFAMFMQELKEQREDMRRLQERQDAMQAKHEAEMHEMNQRFYDKVDALSNQIHDTWKQTMIGVGGMIIALGALLITALK